MKRPHTPDGDGIHGLKEEEEEKKKTKVEEKESGRTLAATATAGPMPTESVLLDENLLYEVLKHVDWRTLAWAACVSKLWKRTAQDERLWELMCLKDGSRRNQQQQQLRNVVLALGGFRRLYSLHLWPLVKPSSSSSSSSSSSPACTWPCLPPPPKPSSAKFAAGKTRWGNDEMNLSLSLLSIRYYEKMNSSNRHKQT
ncbi:PREDICTED: F-box protein GID2-like [Ipomoea nil]|uniref:F-box protein GID2-like n=1 Tax=Ipomoea nil TaxID=35883 RepID=UPI000901831C|nr:PREDICTED: F-box protein GID2-like [Ipomoea nil]